MVQLGISSRCPFCTPGRLLEYGTKPCDECLAVRDIHVRAESDAAAEAESQRWIAENAVRMRWQQVRAEW